MSDTNSRHSHASAYSHRPSGFTLLELVIAIGILAVATIAILTAITADVEFRVRAEIQRDVESDVTVGLRAVDAVLRGATAILPAATIGDRTITTGADAIAFTVPTVDAGGRVLGTRDTVAIARASDAPALLELRVAPAASSHLPAGTRIIARRITALGFRYGNSDPTRARTVQVAIESRATIGTRTARTAHATIIALRNAP